MRHYSKNPRQITKKQFADLQDSLRRLGDLGGIVHDLTTDEIIGGNQRMDVFDLKTCQIEITERLDQPDEQGTVALGWVVWQGKKYSYRAVMWDDKTREEANIRANKAGGSWDFDILANEFEVDELVEWGFSPEELGIEVEKETKDAEPQINRAAEINEKWQVKTGDLWQIGDHRLLCGDSTKREDVERVMGGEKARLCFTSPPYGNARDYEIGEFDYQALYSGFSDLAFSFCDDILVNLGLIHKDGSVFRYWEEWLNYCEANGNELFGWYVWDQQSGMPGDFHGRLARSHEWVFHFSKSHISANKWIKTTGESLKRVASGKRFRQKDGSMKELGSPGAVGQPFKVPDSVVRIHREMVRGIHTESHPAVFPVEFSEFGVQTWSNKQDLVYEPFAGSGTTLVACENLSRKCRAIEISPNYCAVILERMATAFPELDIHRVQ